MISAGSLIWPFFISVPSISNFINSNGTQKIPTVMLYKIPQVLNDFGLCHHFVSKGICFYASAKTSDSIFLPVGTEELNFKTVIIQFHCV